MTSECKYSDVYSIFKSDLINNMDHIFLIRNNDFLGIKDKQEHIHHLKLMHNA